MGYSPYSELINKMQKEIEILRGISAGSQEDIFHKLQEEITETNSKLHKANKEINSLKIWNKELSKKNDALHMSFMVLENSKLKDENTLLKKSVDTINKELQKLKETAKPKKKKTTSHKKHGA